MRLRTALALSLVLTASSTGLASAAGTTTPAAPAAFSDSVALFNTAGGSTLAAEPSIEVDRKGHVFVSGPAGVPTGGCPFWEVHPDSAGPTGLPYDYRGTIDTDHNSVGGGDCDISITPQPSSTYDDVSVTSLSLANLTSNVTTDGGRSFVAAANPASQQVFGVDRQWQASDQSLNRHYLTVHDLATDNVEVSVATDGGYAYVQNTPAITPDLYPGARTNHFGALAVNQVTHKLYVPFLAPAGGSGEHGVYVAEGDPCAPVACTVGGPVGPITWTDHLVYTAPSGTKLSHIFPALALDAAGTIYVSWTGNTKTPPTAGLNMNGSGVFVAHSTGSAATWSVPVALADLTTHANMFPWVVAGAPGNVAVAWYAGSLSPTATTCTGRSGGAVDTNGVNNNCLNDWSVTWTQSTDGGDTFTRSVLPEVVHRGSVCDSGTTCATQMPSPGDRTLLDFFDVALDPQGRPNIAFVSDTRAPGTADIHYTRLCSGTTLLGSTLSGPCGPLGRPTACAADAAYTDPAGDAVNVLGMPKLPQSDPAYDITAGRLTSEPGGVVFHTRIPALGTATEGTISETHFSVRGQGFYVSAQRATATGALTYTYGTSTAAAYRTPLGTSTGSFDDTAGEVTVLFPRTALGAATPLTDGELIASGADTTTRRDGVRLVPDVDVAVNPCAYAVGAARLDAPPADVPEAPAAVLVPLAGLAVLGTWVWRRRRTA